MIFKFPGFQPKRLSPDAFTCIKGTLGFGIASGSPGNFFFCIIGLNYNRSIYSVALSLARKTEVHFLISVSQKSGKIDLGAFKSGFLNNDSIPSDHQLALKILKMLINFESAINFPVF